MTETELLAQRADLLDRACDVAETMDAAALEAKRASRPTLRAAHAADTMRYAREVGEICDEIFDIDRELMVHYRALVARSRRTGQPVGPFRRARRWPPAVTHV
jgi:hypothetical protein